MFHRRTCFADDYKKDIASGRGSGRFSEYRPYLEVQDVPSKALRFKVPLLRTGRIHHLLSHGEFIALLKFDWMDSVVEICEQYPLDPAVTKSICGALDLRHPSFAGRPTVITSDFLVTYDDGFSCERKAYQVKATRQDAQFGRTAEKLEIEKEYWSRLGVQWELMVKEEFNPVFSLNLEMLHQLRNTPFKAADIEDGLDVWEQIVDDVDPECTLAELSVFCATIGRRVFDGFQIALLLLGRKYLAAPIERVRLDKIKIGDVDGKWCRLRNCEVGIEAERRL